MRKGDWIFINRAVHDIILVEGGECMIRFLELLFALAALVLVLSNWFFSLNVSFDLVALVLALLYFFTGIHYLRDDRVIRGTVILVVSSMMAFIFIESFIPIT